MQIEAFSWILDVFPLARALTNADRKYKDYVYRKMLVQEYLKK